MRSLYYLTCSDSKETCCSKGNLRLHVIIWIRALHRNYVVMHMHVREKVIFHSGSARLSSKLFYFLLNNLKQKLQEAPSLSIKAATLRIKIISRNVSA